MPTRITMPKPVDFTGIETTSNREYKAKYISKINDALKDLPEMQRAEILGTIIEESGGDPMAKSKGGTYQGLLQWGADRYRIQSDDPEVELENQLKYLQSTLNNTTDKKSWTRGGNGSGYSSYEDTYNAFNNPTLPIEDSYRAFSYGYVRPAGKEDSYKNRLKVVKQIYNRMEAAKSKVIHTEDNDATMVSRPPIVLPIHKKDYGGVMFGEGGYTDDDISENTEAEVQAKAQYPFLNGLDFKIYSDPNYRASDYNDNGRNFGNIETFFNGTSRVKYSVLLTNRVISL